MEPMPERTDLLRVALAQLNPTVGDIRGNARKISDGIARARDEGASLVVFPELCLTGYPPEDLLLKTTLPGRRRRRASGARGPDPGDRRRGGLPGEGRGRLQQRRGAGRRRRGGHLPQDVPAELRGLRRAALLPVRRRGGDRRAERRADRAQHLRGHLGAGPAGDDRGARGRAGDPEPVRLPLSPRRGRRARAHADPARGGQPHGRGLREHGGRPGRARLRRPQPRDRPGRPDPGQGAAVRGGAHHLHHRPARDHGRTAARHAPPRERAKATARRTRRRATGVHAGEHQHRGQRRARAGLRRAGRHAGPRGGGLRRAAHRPARLRGEERLRARGDRALRRDRLRAGRARGRGRARPGAGHVRVDALPLLERGHAKRRARDRREPRRRLPRDRHRAARWTRTRRCCARPSTAASRT